MSALHFTKDDFEHEVLESDTGPWNGMIRIGVEELTVPPPETLDAEPGQLYWDRADLRIMLDLNGPPVVELRNVDNTLDVAGTGFLDGGCGGLGGDPVGETSDSFHNLREATDISMLEIDMADLLDCIEVNNALMGGKMLDDSTEGGLVFYFGGNAEMRGYDYLQFLGQKAFYGNAELRFPLASAIATPIGILGGVRGVFFFNFGAVGFNNVPFDVWTSDPTFLRPVVGFSLNPETQQAQEVFGDPVAVDGFRLVNGRASYGIGLSTMVIGFPLHFDWAWRTLFNRNWEPHRV